MIGILKGRVFILENKSLSGVVLCLKGTSYNARTYEDSAFELKVVLADYILVISYLGMKVV